MSSSVFKNLGCKVDPTTPRVYTSTPRDNRDKMISPGTSGVYTITLTKIPTYGKIRVIMTPGCYSTNLDDDVVEFNFIELQDPTLHSIRKRLID